MIRTLLTISCFVAVLLSACNCGQSSCGEQSNESCLSPEAASAVTQKVTTPTGPTVTARGNAIQLFAPLPKVGEVAPDATLANEELGDIAISSFKGQTIVLNIFPSVDTKTCSMSVRQFNELAAELPNVQVLCISMDLPFALGRFCAAEGIKNVKTLSAFRSEFPKTYGVQIANGPMTGLCARAVVIIDPDFKVAYTQLVSELTNEPDYQKALEYLKK